jgi:hypothetical protein
MAWTRLAAAALLLAVTAPSHARFDLGNVGIPTTSPGVFDPTDPPVVEPPPPIALPFEVELDGKLRRGSYVAKLRSQEV